MLGGLWGWWSLLLGPCGLDVSGGFVEYLCMCGGDIWW